MSTLVKVYNNILYVEQLGIGMTWSLHFMDVSSARVPDTERNPQVLS